ncbi:hypothetical protein ACWO4B_003215 [Clostridium sporogenes]
MEQKEIKKSNSLKQSINRFCLKLQEKEFKKIVNLDIYRCFKILTIVWGYMIWLFIAQIGFKNLYSVIKVFNLEINEKSVVNSFGNTSFIVLLITLIVLIAFELIQLSIRSIDYAVLLCSLKNKLSSVLRLGTIIFLMGIYTHEVELKSYRNVLIYVVFQLSLFGIFTLLEKVTFNQIRKDIEKEIEMKNFSIETTYGKLNNIPLQTFRTGSKWRKHIFRSKHYSTGIFYNEKIYAALKSTNALRGNEPLILKDFFGDYEMTIEPVEKN